jgi:hypothetical protein
MNTTLPNERKDIWLILICILIFYLYYLLPRSGIWALGPFLCHDLLNNHCTDLLIVLILSIVLDHTVVVKFKKNGGEFWLKQHHTCEPSGGSIFLPILRVPSVNFQNLPPVKKIKYNKILTYILRSIFLEIPHLELLRWRKTQRDTKGKGECHI